MLVLRIRPGAEKNAVSPARADEGIGPYGAELFPVVGVDPQIDPKRRRTGNVRINGKRPTAGAGALLRRPQRSEFSQVRALMM